MLYGVDLYHINCQSKLQRTYDLSWLFQYNCPNFNFLFIFLTFVSCGGNRCIPYRRKANTESHSDNLIDRLEVLMISSPNRDDLVFPKV